MLIITGKKCERIMIGRDIEIIVLNVSANRVRLGIRAREDMPVWRRELVHGHSRLQSEKPR